MVLLKVGFEIPIFALLSYLDGWGWVRWTGPIEISWSGSMVDAPHPTALWLLFLSLVDFLLYFSWFACWDFTVFTKNVFLWIIFHFKKRYNDMTAIYLILLTIIYLMDNSNFYLILLGFYLRWFWIFFFLQNVII